MSPYLFMLLFPLAWGGIFWWASTVDDKKRLEKQTERLTPALEMAKSLGMDAEFRQTKYMKWVAINTKYATIELQYHRSNDAFYTIVKRDKEEPYFVYTITCRDYEVILGTLNNLLDKE